MIILQKENIITWTRIVVAYSCFLTIPRTWLSSKGRWGIGTSSCPGLFTASTCDRTVAPVIPSRPVTVDCKNGFVSIKNNDVTRATNHHESGQNILRKITWTWIFIACPRFLAFSRTLISSKLRWGIGTSS